MKIWIKFARMFIKKITQILTKMRGGGGGVIHTRIRDAAEVTAPTATP
jgi:hypothetical protein